jgi:hypothetical protein
LSSLWSRSSLKHIQIQRQRCCKYLRGRSSCAGARCRPGPRQ